MLEKRQAIRYRVEENTDIVIFHDDGNLLAPLVDLSWTGLMAVISESESRHLSPGREVRGQLRRCSEVTNWRGRVVHRSPTHHGMGIGIAFDAEASSKVTAAVKEIVQQPNVGGLNLRRQDQALVLEIHGRLSFLLSRDALPYIQRKAIACIDLACCHSVDSAGLGMLGLARDEGVAITGARGAVKNLLAIARIDGCNQEPPALKDPPFRTH